MSIRHLYWLSMLVLAVTCPTGCQKDPLEELAKQSPFHQMPAQPATDLLVLTCRCHTLLLGGQVDISSSDLFKRYGLGAGRSITDGGPAADRALGSMDRQLGCWWNNGLAVAVAPLSEWNDLWEQILLLGGVQREDRTAIFRDATQSAPFETFAIERTSVFVLDAKLNGRGYTLEAGRCAFRVNCQPWNVRAGEEAVYLSVAPVFVGEQPRRTFAMDETGNYRLTRQQEQQVFEELILEGTVKADQFICIAARTQNLEPGSLAEVFLRGAGDDGGQIVLVLVPGIQTARQIMSQQ